MLRKKAAAPQPVPEEEGHAQAEAGSSRAPHCDRHAATAAEPASAIGLSNHDHNPEECTEFEREGNGMLCVLNDGFYTCSFIFIAGTKRENGTGKLRYY